MIYTKISKIVQETKKEASKHTHERRQKDCREHNFIAFQMAKKIYNTNICMFRFDWNRRACLVYLNVLCAVSFSYRHTVVMCCPFFPHLFLRFGWFRFIFIWFEPFYLHSSHICNIMIIIIVSLLLSFGWTSEIIAFKLKLYIGCIISVNIIFHCCCCLPKTPENISTNFSFILRQFTQYWPIFYSEIGRRMTFRLSEIASHR